MGAMRIQLLSDLHLETETFDPQPAPDAEVHLRADQAVAYRVVAETLADASRAGLHKVGFVSEPEAGR